VKHEILTIVEDIHSLVSIVIIITYSISCWQNAAKQYVVIVKL